MLEPAALESAADETYEAPPDEAAPLPDPEPAEEALPAAALTPPPPLPPALPPDSAAMRLIAASHLAQVRPRVQKETGFLENRPYNICWPDGLLKHLPELSS